MEALKASIASLVAEKLYSLLARHMLRQHPARPTSGPTTANWVHLYFLRQCYALLTRADLIKYDTPHLGPRIQLMLSQLEFKLSVEKQYKDGIEKMVRLYQMEGDRKSKQDAEAKRIESNQKIQLLKHSLKRYEDLHVDIEGDAGGDGKLQLD
jgi:hypothetical protein